MDYRSLEPRAYQHLDELRREAADRRLAAMVDRGPGARATLVSRWVTLRGLVGRLTSVGRRGPVDVARPRRDLGSPGRP